MLKGGQGAALELHAGCSGEPRWEDRAINQQLFIVLALDSLSRLASCYGRCGRRVFEANQAPIVNAIHLFECVPVAEAEKMLVEPLEIWLQDLPEFDLEGWALAVFGRS